MSFTFTYNVPFKSKPFIHYLTYITHFWEATRKTPENRIKPYIKPYIKKSETIVRYLSRYTYKIAISNHRITGINEDQVSFRWKDYRDGQQKMMQLDGDEFIRRFLLHVLPKGFMRVRHFGFLANATRKKKLETIRQLMDEQPEKRPEKIVSQSIIQIDGDEVIKPCLCPACKKGSMVISYWVLPLKRRRIQNG